MGWRHPLPSSDGGAFLLEATGARLLRASAIHFVETYNLTRVLMSVANKYSNDRRRAWASLSGERGRRARERDGEALLAKYLGGQLGGVGSGQLEDGPAGGAADVPGPAPADVLSAYCRRGHALQYCVRSAILPPSNSI